MRTGHSAKRSLNVWKCCCASRVVGTRSATCHPSMAAANAARIATSVLPNPTSPQTSRSIGRSLRRSSRVGLDRGCLVGGLLEGEAFGEGGVLPVVERDHVAGPRRAPGLDLEELRRDVAHPGGGRLARLLPLLAAELVQGRVLGARVARHEVQGEHRDVELVAVRVLDVQVLAGDPGRGQHDEPPVAPDPVALVHHRVSRLELGETADDALRVARAGPPPACPRPASEEEGLGQDRDGGVVEDRAPLDFGEDDYRSARRPGRGGIAASRRIGGGGGRGASQGLHEDLQPARRLDEEQGPAREPPEELPEEGERFGRARIGGEGGRVRGPEPDPPARPFARPTRPALPVCPGAPCRAGT